MDVNSPELIAELPASESKEDQAAPPSNGTSEAARTLTVGVFDSGVGGFTVAGAILKRRPDLSLVYFGDSLNLPYGGRTPEQLARFAHHTIEFLQAHGMEILAVGCNASNSALGQADLRTYGVPVFDLVGSTIDWLRTRPRQPEHLALLATGATVRSGYWERKLADAFPNLKVTAIAAPDLVPLIEATPQDEHAIRQSVADYVAAIRESGADTVLLGCTHYPLIQSYMMEADALLSVVDPAQCLADRLVASLPPAEAGARSGGLSFFNSLPSERFYAVGERVFGRPIRQLTRMYIVNPYED